jgi:hypothetical protein
VYVYSGCACPAVNTHIATDDDGCVTPAYGTPRVSWNAVAGQQYMIEVGNYTGELGQFVMTLSCLEAQDPPVNDDCADADHQNITWDVPAVFTGTTEWATNDCAELEDPEVWISFTLPAGCSNLALSYCAGYEGGPGWSVWAHFYDACPCGAGGYSYNSYTFSCPGGTTNFSMTVDSVMGGTYWYPVNQANLGGGWEYVITITAVECPPYCPAAGQCDEYIHSVALNTINNVSAECSAGGYGDYTDVYSTDLFKGVSYTLNVATALAWSTDQVGAWIDYDLDFLFEPEEYYYLGTGLGPFSGTITPPVTAITGETTLRVRLRWNGVPEPCGTYWGEVEDYTIVLKDLPCGDVNFDGLFNEADVTYLVNYYFYNGPAPLPIPANGDTNGDCCLNIADIVFLADYINYGTVDLICLPCNP